MAKVEAILSMYFSEIDKEVSILSGAECDYRKYLIDGAKMRIAERTRTPPDNHIDSIGEVYGNLAAAQNNLIEAARKLMVGLLKP